MEKSRWFDESHFPAPEGYRSAEEWATGVFNSIEAQHQRKRGGKIKPVLRRVMRGYARAYAIAEMHSHASLRPRTLRFATKAQNEEVSDDGAAVNAKRLKNRFLEQGWLDGDTSWIPESSEFSNDAFVLVREQVWPAPESNIRDEGVFSRTELKNLARSRLEEYLAEHNPETEPEDSDVEAVTATIETRLDRRGWTRVDEIEGGSRIWLKPEETYESLSIDANFDQITGVEIREEVIGYFQSLDVQLRDDSSFDLSSIVSFFGQQLEGRNWQNIQRPAVSDNEVLIEQEWYQDQNTAREVVAELLDAYRQFFENPRVDAEADQLKSRRKETIEFYERNREKLIEFNFYSDRRKLGKRISRFEWHLDAAESWVVHDSAEPGRGNWNPGENDFKSDNYPTR